MTYGECESCDLGVDDPDSGDRVCSECLAEEAEDNEEALERLREEDRYLYSIPVGDPRA